MTPKRSGSDGEFSPAAVRTTWGVIVGIILLLGGLGVAGEVRDVVRGVRAESWPTTRAEVTRVWGGGQSQSRGLEYAYRVEGSRYTSQRVGYSLPPFHNEYRLHDVGDTIEIRFDPTRPSSAVIRPGMSLSGFLSGLLLSLMALALGLYLLTKPPGPEAAHKAGRGR